MSPERVLSASLIRLRTRIPFLATLALLTRIEPGVYTPTMATNGRDILCNPEYLTSMSHAVVDASVLHNVLHAALLHLPRRGDRDPLLWNVAADIVVNVIIESIAEEGINRYNRTSWLTLFPNAIRDPELQHGTVDEVYDALAARPSPPEIPYPLRDLQDTPESDPAQLLSYWKAAWIAAREFGEGESSHVVPPQLDRELTQVAQSVANAIPREAYDPQAEVEAILSGQGEGVRLPEDPLSRFMLITNLAKRAGSGESVGLAFFWMIESAQPEHVQFFAVDIFRRLRAAKKMGDLANLIARASTVRKFFEDYCVLMAS